MLNCLTTNSEWSNLTETDRASVGAQHPINRVTGTPPADGNGYWSSNRSYTAGGAAVTRQDFHPL